MSTVPNAYGSFLSNAAPLLANSAQLSGPNGTLLKPGGRVAGYVRSTGAQDGDDQFAVSGLLVSSINEASKRCRPGQNDIIYVLQGHVETISGADGWANLVAGTQIISCGIPGNSNNPTINFTAAASSLLLDVADVSLVGFNLDFAGIDSIDQPITVSAQGVLIASNFITLGKEAGATDIGCDAGILLDGGSNNARVINNFFVNYAGTIAESAQSGSVVAVGNAAGDISRNVQIAGNYFSASTTGDTIGIVDVVGVASDLFITDNYFIQRAADGAFAITIASIVGTHGVVVRNKIRLTENIAPTSGGILVGASALILLDDNRMSAANAAATATHAADV